MLSTANYLKSNAASLAAGIFAHALLPALSLRSIKGLVQPKTEILPSFTSCFSKPYFLPTFLNTQIHIVVGHLGSSITVILHRISGMDRWKVCSLFFMQ